MAFCISFMDTRSSFIVAEMVPALCVTCCSMQKRALISVGAGACSLIIFGTVNIWAVVEGSVPSAYWSAASLVQEVPVETGKRTVLCTFMLYEQGTLLRSKLLQISGKELVQNGPYQADCS